MKIEKLNKDNIKNFISDMEFSDDDFIEKLEKDINRKELFSVVENGIYYFGFESNINVDTISISYYNNKLSDDKFYKCIEFLSNSLVVDSYLVITVFDNKYMTLLDNKYKCRGMLVTYDNEYIDNVEFDRAVREKYAEIEMKSIKYFDSKDMVTCNLVRQNIVDEKLIFDLHNYFKDHDFKIINFFIFDDSYEYLKSLGYEYVSKSYAINSLF